MRSNSPVIIKSRWIALTLSFVMLTGYTGLTFLNQERERKSVPSQKNLPIHPSNKFEITNFDFQSYLASHLQIQIQANRFIIKKKRIGSLSFGLLNDATFYNAKVKLFGSMQYDNYEKDDLSTNNPNSPKGDIQFSDAFIHNSFLNLPIRNIASITMKDIQFELYNDNQLISKISATLANFRIKERDIFFKGNVITESGEKILATDELIFSPEESKIQTQKRYALATAQKTSTGKSFTTDIYLND